MGPEHGHSETGRNHLPPPQPLNKPDKEAPLVPRADAASPLSESAFSDALRSSDVKQQRDPQPLKPKTLPAEAQKRELAVQKGSRRYTDPRPSRLLIALTTPVNRVFNLYGIPLLRRIPFVKEFPLVSGLVRVKRIEFPKEDFSRLKKAASGGNGVFFAPNHPEFFTDWMIDKEVTTRVAPMTAHWAAHEIVNSDPVSRRFWATQNIIANCPGGKGKEYSVNWALKGNGVLLHPEGRVRWTGSTVHTLFSGVSNMAIQTAQEMLKRPEAERKAVYIAPFISRFTFERDVSKELHREMGKVEKKLDLPNNRKLSVAQRFFEIQRGILERSEARFGDSTAPRPPITGENFFDRQRALFDHIKAELESRYGAQAGSDAQQIHDLTKAARQHKDTYSEFYKDDKRRLTEMDRLLGFPREIYGSETLSQEQIAESLKRIKSDLIGKTLLDRIRKSIPIPVAERRCDIRVPEPIEVTELVAKHRGDEASLSADINATLRVRMQVTLDKIGAETALISGKFAHRNPFQR